MSFPTLTPITTQNSSAAQKSSTPVLKEGQLFHGQIKQLFPGQMAEVQIGGQKLVAKLEIPMRAGDSYYFQVNSVQPELQLKIISGPLQGTEGQGRQLSGLMDAMKLPNTPEMQSLLTFVMQNKIPMTRENLIEAAALLKTVPANMRNEALQSIQKLTELKLPLNETLFRSMMGVETKEGLHSIVTALRNALLQDSTMDPQIKTAILSTMTNAIKPFSQATGTALLGQAFLTLLNSAEMPENRFGALQLLKNTGLLPQQTSLANLSQILSQVLTTGEGIQGNKTDIQLSQLQQMTATMANEKNGTSLIPQNQLGNGPSTQTTQQQSQQIPALLRQLSSTPASGQLAVIEMMRTAIQMDDSMTAQHKGELLTLIDRSGVSVQNPETIANLVKEVSQALVRQSAETLVSSPFQQLGQPENSTQRLLSLIGHSQQVPERLETFLKAAENTESGVVKNMLNAAETNVSAAIDGRAMKEALQAVMRSLGLNYEAGMLSKDTDFSRLAEALKPQLLELLQNHTLTPAVREAAETVVMRMNGPLLQSGENGVQHQLVMQVPLEFFGKRIDTTMEWNGRMKDDGKIDADYARILFYLDLESLEKTIIDMQVQNRVVSITVFNADDALKTVGIPLQKKLKAGLESTGYKLSGVFFKGFEEHGQKTPKKEGIPSSEGQGVDFRI